MNQFFKATLTHPWPKGGVRQRGSLLNLWGNRLFVAEQMVAGCHPRLVCPKGQSDFSSFLFLPFHTLGKQNLSLNILCVQYKAFLSEDP